MRGANELYSSYEDMYLSQYGYIYKYLRRMIRNNEDAVEDLTQEVFFIAYVKWDRLKTHPNITGFLMRVAQNKIKKWFEKQSKMFVDDSAVLDYVTGNEKKDGSLDAYKMIDFYSSVENTLSNRDLTILRYYYEYGYTSSEMAKRLGITESCFKVRVARMKEKLKNSMKMLVFFFAFFSMWNIWRL